MIARLFPPDDNDPFLCARDVAARIVAALPNVRVDEDAANRRLLDELASLKAREVPAPIIEGHMNLFGQTVDMEVCCEENGGVRFSVYPDSAIEVFAIETDGAPADPESLGALVLRIAGALEYDAEFV